LSTGDNCHGRPGAWSLMSTEFGPLDSDGEDSGLSWRLAGASIATFVTGMQLLGLSTRYDRVQNRYSLHGESDRAGSPLRAGVLMGLVPAMTLVTWLTIGLLILQAQSFAVGTVFLTLLSSLVVVWGIIGLVMIDGLGERMTSATVTDHTTEPVDDCDDLKQRYLSGEIDERELEAETEARLE